MAKLIKPKLKKPSVTLKLTHDEATTLYAMTFRVGGDPLGHRGLIDNIQTAMDPLGLSEDTDFISSGLQFKFTKDFTKE